MVVTLGDDLEGQLCLGGVHGEHGEVVDDQQLGALFAAPCDVGQLLRTVTAVLDHPSSEMLERAQNWLARGNNQRTNPEDLFAFIPRALRMAQARNEGLVVLTARG